MARKVRPDAATLSDKVRIMLKENYLTQVWLIKQLAERGITVSGTELTTMLNGTRKGPKAENTIAESYEIVTGYENAMRREKGATG